MEVIVYAFFCFFEILIIESISLNLAMSGVVSFMRNKKLKEDTSLGCCGVRCLDAGGCVSLQTGSVGKQSSNVVASL